MATNGVSGRLHDCYASTDPRTNKDLVKTLSDKNVLMLEANEVEEVAKLCKGTDGRIGTKTRALDVRDAVAVKDFVHEVVSDFGGIDVLIFNAARPPQWLPLSEGSPELWWESVEIGIRGSYNFSRYVLPVMQKQKSGTIILVGSMGAHGNAGYSSYTTAKLGILRLAEIIHAENFKEYNIKAFCDASEGRFEPGSYIIRGAEGEEKSVAIAMEHFGHITEWDKPEMGAGMMTVLCSGRLDFLSGRFIDSGLKVETYLQQKQEILEQDLFRVRLNAGSDGLIPTLKY
ncbi:Dehydrogenase/ SDR family member 4 [Cyphellophora attinorum]|uniref:Dehydrogenase/ SDR family member 4 n=1 Tax=Cyphellophora attinorum TaxID=1664694 RepID=A0A0N0NNY4_9EURO|nr:Dehydrogenase/ SDR family member 4 [Phialophora attinorum]KPI42121.1 Dehydrogenase/ SDR family member 4 [Phialophora attinorum]